VSTTSLFRLVALAAMIGVTALVGAGLAGATTASGSQNPDLTATSSLALVAEGDAIAGYGDRIDETFSVTNNTSVEQLCHVFMVGDLPTADIDRDKIVKIKPGETWSWGHTLRVGKKVPSGTYSIQTYAVGTGSIEVSNASASITVSNG
jgi:hypothetical protein